MVTLLATDLIVVVVVMVVGFASSYFLLLSRLKAMVSERQLKLADQLGGLDDAIRALETRLREHQVQPLSMEPPRDMVSEGESRTGISEREIEGELAEEIAPEIQAAIAAASVMTLGSSAAVQSVKPVPSPWSQQGRVMVQGGHNLRVRR